MHQKLTQQADDDDKLEAVWKSEYPLGEFISPDTYKSYDELKAKLYRVLALGETETVNTPAESFATAPKAASAPTMPSATAAAAEVPLVIGDAVNLGARLEGQTRNYDGVDVLLSEECYKQCPDGAFTEVDRILVKGKSEKVTIYTVQC